MKIILSIFVIFSTVNAEEVLDASIYKPESVVYTGTSNIVAIHAPIYMYNRTDVNDEIFIVEENLGIYKGTLDINNAKEQFNMKKILGNGKCMTSDKDNVYFGATDGIYTYNFETNKAEKYGNIAVEVNGIQKDTERDLIYIIASDQLYKLQGTNMDKVESVNNVQEIVLDKDNNLYLYEKTSSSKFLGLYKDVTFTPKIIVDDKIIFVKDLPKIKSIKIVKTLATKEGVLFVLDNRVYRVFANGSSEATEFVFESAPSAYFIDLPIAQLYGHGNKLYIFNVLESLLLGIKSSLSSLFES